MDNEVRKLLEEYNTEFIKFRRNVEDALENIDLDNLSPRVKAYITKSGAARAGFEVGGLSDGAYARMFAEFKNARDKAFAEFKAEVSSKYATVKMLSDYQTDTSKAIAGMQATANASGAFIDIFTAAGNGTLKKDADGNYAVTADGEYIFVKDGAETPISQADVAGLFISELNGGKSEIKLRADRIKLGDGVGVYGDGNLYLCKLFGPSNVASGSYPGQFYIEVDSDFDSGAGTFGGDLFMKQVSSVQSGGGVPQSDGATLYGFEYGNSIENGVTNKGVSVNFVVGRRENGASSDSKKYLWGYNYKEDKFYTKGAWDFSSAQVSGLVVRFS